MILSSPLKNDFPRATAVSAVRFLGGILTNRTAHRAVAPIFQQAVMLHAVRNDTFSRLTASRRRRFFLPRGRLRLAVKRAIPCRGRYRTPSTRNRERAKKIPRNSAKRPTESHNASIAPITGSRTEWRWERTIRSTPEIGLHPPLEFEAEIRGQVWYHRRPPACSPCCAMRAWRTSQVERVHSPDQRTPPS